MSRSPSKGSPETGIRETAANVWRVVPWVVCVLALHMFLTGDLAGQTADGVAAPGDEASDAVPMPAPPAPPPKLDPVDEPAAVELSAAAKARYPRPVPLVVRSAADIENVEDPAALYAAGRHWLANGKKELARASFEAAVLREELNLYQSFAGTPFGEASVLEHLGDWEASRAAWRATFNDDVVTAMFFIAQVSIDPEKNKLLDAAEVHARGLVDVALAGGEAHFYTTKKGKSRKLKIVTQEEALAAFAEGKALKYAYIDHLDLTNQTFPKRVGCKRCLVGTLETYGSTFEEQFDFHGVVFGEAHLGKKWTGEVNKSKPIPAGSFNKLYLGNSVFLHGLNLDSLKITGRLANFPKMVVRGDTDLRNADFAGIAEFRYSSMTGKLNLRGAQFHDAVYFGHANVGALDLSRVQAHASPMFFDSSRFAGPIVMERAKLHHGTTFENSTFMGDVVFQQSAIGDRLNLSRALFLGDLNISFVEAEDVDALGIEVLGNTRFTDSVFTGNVRFALDGLTRRLHLDDVSPLHPLYKQYQGDVDAEENLTNASQYGVVSVDDLVTRFSGDVSFANTIFQKFVSFEGVRFGVRGEHTETSFYNAQLFGEAHFERTEFYSAADFRTISGIEISFNDATFHESWLLDDANIPGRLTSSGVEMVGDATLSFYGARLASFNITFAQLRYADETHRLFYEQCFLSGLDNADFVEDPRLLAARWNSEEEVAITDADVVSKNVRKLCGDRTIAEFVLLKDSFSKRSMAQEGDWAYWHLRHYKNEQLIVEADDFGTKLYGYVQWILFEKAFGWGVRLGNLLGTGLVVILLYILLLRIFCQNMLVEWDGEPLYFRDLPYHAWFVISFHSFLGRARDWRAKETNRAWKILYTSEMIIGIILITFFIGAYTRMVLR